MPLPPAIVFVNADITDGIKSVLSTQLFINETMSDTEFDARVKADPNYPTNVHLRGLRIMVIRQSFQDLTNRNLADLVLFIKQGQAIVEKNNFGPPGLSLPIARLNIYDLLRFNNSKYVITLPNIPPSPSHCNCMPNNFGPGGIVGEELRADDSSGVHAANCDNEYNNPDFINRK